MTRLHIDLREGFDGDDVEIDVDGRRVYARSGVRTDYSVGLADSVEVEVGGAAARVHVWLRGRGLAAEKSVPLQAPVQYLAVTAAPTAIGLAALEEAPRYF